MSNFVLLGRLVIQGDLECDLNMNIFIFRLYFRP